MPDNIVDESLFPKRPRQAINELWRLARCLREVRGVEPIRVTRSDANLVVELAPEAQQAMDQVMNNINALGQIAVIGGSGGESGDLSSRVMIVCTDGAPETIQVVIVT